MNRFAARWLLLVFPSLMGCPAWAQTVPSHLAETKARKSDASSSRAIAPIARQQLFGTLPLGTRSEETRTLIETAIDQYENVVLDASIASSRKAAERDPHSALAYAVWSFAARRGEPAPEALQRAKSLAPHATPDERLLVDWMLDVQQGSMLPAIRTMNDLLARFPNDKHILYLTSEWLYFQQDYDRSRKMMEKILELDPNFAPALNMLGYANIETGEPNPAKAIDYLKRYAAVQPHQPNPEDSLGEVLRYAGDDLNSLVHYATALHIDPHFVTSRIGLGDTSALMGDYQRAREEYDKALPIITTPRDRLHAQFQRTLVYFWEGQPTQGRTALEILFENVRRQKDPYALYEVGFGRALLAAEAVSELEQLRKVEASLLKPVRGMSEPDRNASLAAVLCEEARVEALHGHADAAREAVVKLERAAKQSRDLVVEDYYEAARGYMLFAKGDFANAVEELAGNPRSPLALQQLALAQDKLGNAAAAEAVRTRLKYLRAPTVEWYLVSHAATAN
jgi:tetratricopeptide (TPR) repeat protein